MSRSPITTHVLDTSRGCPAVGLPITLSVLSDSASSEWNVLGKGYLKRSIYAHKNVLLCKNM